MSTVKTSRFLKDVLVCSLGAYGGPEAHFGVFTDQLVTKRKYLTEEELVELLALCSILPGPTSTQTIVAAGYKTGGPRLALLTMLVWALPALLMMTALSFLYTALSSAHISADILRFIAPMAVGFILLAAWRIGRKTVKDRTTAALMLFGLSATYFVRSPWIFPLILLCGGAVSILLSKKTGLWNRVRLSPPWRYMILFLLLAGGSALLPISSASGIPSLFESFFRYGYLVFGGGQVVVPVMYGELVDLNGLMSPDEFLTGYGLVQGLPGPMFSFAAYAGGMASRGGTVLHQIGGALAGGAGIFLPGLLLIYFIYPVWTELKKIKAVKLALTGINAVAGGMIAAAAVILLQTSGFRPSALFVSALTVAALATRKIPAPLMVAGVLAAGVLFQ